MSATQQVRPARPFDALGAAGTSVWLDSLSRSLIESGGLERLVREMGVSGVTANPSLFAKAFAGGEYDAPLARLAGRGLDPFAAYEAVAVEDVRAAADVLRPVYERTRGRDGYASLEVAPDLAHDADATVASALDLWARLDRPNAMVKIPATRAGIDAIRRATAVGVNVNVTLLFSVDVHERVADAHLAGLEDRAARGEPLRGVVSVASFFVSRLDAAVDPLLAERARDDLAGRAGIANARLAYARFRTIFSRARFARLAARGATPQRPLWASTGVKDPRYRDVMYVEELAGPNTIATVPPATLEAFADHGVPRDALTGTEPEARRTLAEVRAAGVDLDAVTARLLAEGIDAFDAAMREVLAGVERRRR